MQPTATSPAAMAARHPLPRRALASAAALSLLLSGACDFLKPAAADAGDAAFPEIQRAALFEQRGEIDKAIDEYRSVLIHHPKNTLAHVNLGLLLQEYKHDFIGAIYHFETYLQLDPRSQKETMIRDHIRQSRQLLGAELSREIITSGSNAQLIQNLQSEQKKVAALLADKTALTEELEQTKAELARVCATTNHLHRRIEMLSAVPLPTSSQPNPAQITAVTQGDDSGVRTYIVKKGDSLSHIAEMVYGDSTQWPRIKNANSLKDDRVKEGMVLTIP